MLFCKPRIMVFKGDKEVRVQEVQEVQEVEEVQHSLKLINFLE
jgi:hypothetical protein